MNKWKTEITNSKGLKFSFHFRPLAKRLKISCENASNLGFVNEVEKVMAPLNLEVKEYLLMGIDYKCSSYKHFEKVVQAVTAT
ncbi:MAG: hypothetical protein IJB90_00355 [Clostridia bacterium]|nr:hypothetical protein [Clostridia bacterium]